MVTDQANGAILEALHRLESQMLSLQIEIPYVSLKSRAGCPLGGKQVSADRFKPLLLAFHPCRYSGSCAQVKHTHGPTPTSEQYLAGSLDRSPRKLLIVIINHYITLFHIVNT